MLAVISVFDFSSHKKQRYAGYYYTDLCLYRDEYVCSNHPTKPLDLFSWTLAVTSVFDFSAHKKQRYAGYYYTDLYVHLDVQGHRLETVTRLKYLGAIISDEGSKPEIISRAAQTATALAKLKTIWRDRYITIKHKIRLMRALVLSIFLYACESWTLTAELVCFIA